MAPGLPHPPFKILHLILPIDIEPKIIFILPINEKFRIV
jgi:hypothetical protein